MAWLAWAALLAIAAVAVATGAAFSLTAFVFGLAGLAVMAAATWTFAAYRGIRRRLATLVLILVPLAVCAAYIATGLLLEVLVCLALAAVAWYAAHSAARAGPRTAAPPQYPATPARRPYLIMNPRSGGGKVERFGLADKATALGAEVELLTADVHADVAALAAHAVDGGADLLGAAGGDGTQALVADVAARRGVPMLVISAGTRNHFAMDLGLDRDDPARCLDALADGVELRIDLGMAGGRPFVNNASFGVYAEIVQSPAYREDKTGTALRMLPDLMSGHRGTRLAVRADGREVLGAPQAVLVSNNPYGGGDIAGLSRRPRLDQGVLGLIGVEVGSEAQAAGLLTPRGQQRAITRLTAREVVVDADAPRIPVGIDGEYVLLPTPVRCTIRPLALRVLVPRDRPGVPAEVDETTLRAALSREALGLTRGTAGAAADGRTRA